MDERERIEFEARLGNLRVLVKSFFEKRLITETEYRTYLLRLWGARIMKDLDVITAELKDIRKEVCNGE